MMKKIFLFVLFISFICPLIWAQAHLDLIIDGNGDDEYGTIGSGAGGHSQKQGTPGTSVQFTIILQNEDNNPDVFQLTWNTPPGWSVTLNGNTSPFQTGQIGANSEVTYTLEVDIPSNATGGITSIILNAQDIQPPINPNKIDSIRADILVPRVDLIIEGNGDNLYGDLGSGAGGSITKLIAQGDRLSLQLTLQNEDEIADAFNLSWNTPAGWDIMVEGHHSPWNTPQISAEGFSNYNITIEVPDSASVGSYDVTLDCQSINNPAKVDSIKMTFQIATIQTDLLIDGDGNDVYDPTGGGGGGASQRNGSPGSYSSFDITLQNESSLDASFQFSLTAFPPAGWQVYVNNGTDHQIYPPASSWITPVIPAGGFANFTLKVFIPADSSPGSYSLKLLAHSSNPINDTQHGDSITATVNVVSARCDLLIEGNGDNVYGAIGSGTGGEASKTSPPASSLQFTITLQNEDSSPDTFQISWNTPSGWTVTLDGHSSPYTTPQLPENGSLSYPLQVTIPQDVVGGTTSIIIDAQSQRLPTIKVDSVRANVTIPRADLTIEGNGDNIYGALGTGNGGSANKLTDPGTTATFQIALQNEDTADDTFQFSLASAPAGWVITINDGTNSHPFPWTTPTIIANGSANYTLEVSVPGGTPAGVYDVILDVQSTDPEKTYKVDSVKATVIVTGIPHADLIIDGDGDNLYGAIGSGAGGLSSKRATPGSTINFQITLQNEDVPQFPGPRFDFFTFTATAPTGWRVTLLGYELPWTPPFSFLRGLSYNLSLLIIVPPWAKTGVYDIILNTQDTDNPTKVDSVTARISILHPADVWPMFHYESTRTGRSKYQGSPSPELKWAFQTGGQVNSSPAIRRQQIQQTDPGTGEEYIAWVDVIYVGSNDGYLYSFDWNGNLRWKWTFDPNNPSPILSGPAVDDQGNVYFGDSNGNFYCLKDNYTPMAPNPPTLLWGHSLNATLRWSSPVIANGIVIASADNGDVYAFYADGALAWQYSTGSTVPPDAEIPPSPAVAPEGTVLIGDGSGILHALYLDGTPKWTFATMGAITSTPTIFWPSVLDPTQPPDPNTYFIYVASRDGNLYEITPGGTQNWVYNIGSPINSSPAVWYPTYQPGQPAPTPAQRVIIVGADNGSLYGIKADGTLLWQVATGGGIVSSPAIGANGVVYVGSKDNKVYAFNVTSGAQEWVFTAPQNEVISSPAIGSDMTIYLGSKDQYLYAILTSGGGYAPLIEKYADRTQVGPMGTITYTIVIGNQGSIPLYDIWVYDPLDPNTSYISAVPLPVSTAGNAVLWYLPFLEPGQFLYLTLTVRVNPGTPMGTWIYNTAFLWDIPSNQTAVQVVMMPISPILYITDQNFNPLNTSSFVSYQADNTVVTAQLVNQRYEWGDRVFLRAIYLPADTTNVEFSLQNSLPGGYFNAVHQLTIEDDPDHPGYKRASGHIHLRPRDNMPTAPPFFPYGIPLGGEGTGWRARTEFLWSATARITTTLGTAQRTLIYSQNQAGERSYFVVNNPLSVEIVYNPLLDPPQPPAPPNNSQIPAGNGNWVYNTQNPDMSNPNHWIPAFFCDFGDVQHNQASARITVRIYNNAHIDLNHIRVESPDIKRMNGSIAIIPHSLPDETDADYPDIPGSRVRAVRADGVDLTQQEISIPAGQYVDVDIYATVPIYQPPADGYVWDSANGVWVPNPNPPLGYRTWNRGHQTNTTLLDRTFMLRIYWDNYRGPRQSGTCSFSSPYWYAPDIWDPASGKPVNFQEEAYRNLILRVVVPPSPSLTVDETVLDFGKLPHGTFPNPLSPIPVKTFTVRNTGNINLLYLRTDREHLVSDSTDPFVFLSRTLILTNIDYNQFPAIYGTAGNPGMIRKAQPDSSQPTSAQFTTTFAFLPTAQPVGVYASTLHIYEDLNNDLILQRDPATGASVEPEATSNPVLKVEVKEALLAQHKPDLLGQILQWPAIARYMTAPNTYGDVQLAFAREDDPVANTWSLIRTRLFATPFANAVPSVPPTEWPDIHLYDDLNNNKPNWDTATTVIASSANVAPFPPIGNPSGDPATDPPLYIRHTEPSWFSDAGGLHLFWRGWAFRYNSQVWDGRIFYSPDGSTIFQIGADAGYKNSPRLTIIPQNYTSTGTPWTLLVWFSGTQGSWGLFYNSNPVNPTNINAWQADRQVPLPSEVTYAKDPFPLWRIMNINGQPTPTLELIYSGFLATRGNIEILMSRYPLFYDVDTGRLTLSGQTLPFPRVVGEVLQRNETGTIYWSRHINWMTRRDDPALAPRIWADGREITGWRWDADKQKWFVEDALLGRIWLDTVAGVITFQQPFIGNVVAEYSPRVLCLTSSTLSDTQPTAVVESSVNIQHPAVGQPGWNGQADPRSGRVYLNRDRIHLFWRRSHSPVAQGQVTLFYKALRVRALSLLPPSGAYGSTAFMDSKGTIWVRVSGASYDWYPMDPLTGTIYFAPEDEGRTITLLFNNQQVIPVLDEELVLNPERMVPIDNITNESQLSAFANYLPGQYMDKIWLSWTRPEATITTICYETFSPSFWR